MPVTARRGSVPEPNVEPGEGPSRLGGGTVERVVGIVSHGRLLPPRRRAGILLAATGALWLGLWMAGSELIVLLHASYLIVLLTALWFGVEETAFVALGVGLLGGPLAPPGFVPETHAWYAWIVRTAFLVLVGVIMAAGAGELRRRRARMEGMFSSLTHLYSATLRGFVLALEMKDEETWAHCERVATNATTMGRELGLPEDACETLYWAGYLHDVGKLATPSNILSKPGKLTEDEFRIVQQHTVKGEELLLSVSSAFDRVAEGVRHHHERWDGTGYPDGLAGEAIPLFGRILGVVDVFEALTSKRPYRAAWSEADAAFVIESEAGAHFDPALAEVFLNLVREDRIHVDGRHGHHAPAEERLVFHPRILSRSAFEPVED